MIVHRVPVRMTLSISAALLAAACSVPISGGGDDAASPSAPEVAADGAAGDGADTGESTDDGGPEESSGSDSLSPVEIFEQAGGAVVFVTNGSFFGSGVHIGDGRILTNAHVVYPSDRVDIGLPDGRRISDVPVGAVDHVYDLAIVGPIDTDLPSLDVEAMDPPAIGTTVHAIGYPGEVEARPSPTMSTGLVSRVRRAAIMGLDFLQIDVRIAGGQSGGALVDGKGRLVGLTGLAEFTEANFGLALSVDDLVVGIDRLDGPNAEQTGAMVDRSAASTQHRLGLDGHDVGAFLIESDVDETLVAELTAEGAGDGWIEVLTLGAQEPAPTDEALLATRDSDVGTTAPYDFDEASTAMGENFADENVSGPESVSRQVQGPGYWWALVGQLSTGFNEFAVTGGTMLVPLVDDDGGVVSPGDTIEGVTDFPGDVDRFDIDLTVGQSIQVSADSLGDTVLIIVDPSGEAVAFDDDSAGLYGLGSIVEFVAETTGRHRIELEQHNGLPAGYVIKVEAAGGA